VAPTFQEVYGESTGDVVVNELNLVLDISVTYVHYWMTPVSNIPLILQNYVSHVLGQ